MQLTAGMQKGAKRKATRSDAPTKQWSIRPTDSRCAPFADSLKVSALLAQVLINRDIIDAEIAKWQSLANSRTEAILQDVTGYLTAGAAE